MATRKTFIPKKGLDNDPLYFLFQWSLITQIRSNSLLQLFVAIPNIWIYFVIVKAGYEFYKNWGELAHKYMVNIAIIIQSSLIPLLLWMFNNQLLKYRKVIMTQFWSLECANEELYTAIKLKCKNIRMVSYLLIALTVTCSLSEITFLGDEDKWQYTVYLIYKLDGWKRTLLLIIHEPVYLIYGYFTAIPLFIMFYTMNHLKFQFYVLNKYVEKLQKPGDYYDLDYQRWIKQHLETCIKIHVNIKRTSKYLMRWFPHITAVFFIIALISFVAPAYFVLEKISPTSNFRILFILITCIIQECVTCFYCQQVTDESEILREYLFNSNWVNWNESNKKTLIILLIVSSDFLKFSRYVVPNAGYQLILRFWRSGYAMLTLFIKLSK